ncbi:MAG: peptidase M14 [Rhodanobacteraceae bacterium]|nr:peptidase M14 [Rhodanobacteraceae bacterium]
MLLRALTLSLACVLSTPVAAADADWTTPAEASDYARTPRYEQTMDWFGRLDAASPALTMFAFGRSPQGRALNALVLASDGIATPEAARASGKPVILVQAGIHAGEIEGKDALMALSRELLFGADRAWLESVVLVLVPIFNVDGHERFGPYNRINQNGPAEMGWRATAQNLNLNRDYIKADAPEMQAWLRLWQAWQPDLLIDLHNTDGADYQYPMTWAFETGPNIHAALGAWQRKTFDETVKPALAQAGWPVAFYVNMKNWDDLRGGLQEGVSAPRFSTGYAAASGRPGLLLESHMVKDHKTRALATLATLREVLRAIATDPDALKAAVAAADGERFDSGTPVPLAFELAESTQPMDFKGYAETRTPSEISGGTWVQYDQTRPETFQVPVQRDIQVSASAPAPAGYLLPPQWTAVAERLQLHGVRMQRLPAAASVEAERHHFSRVEWAPRPFEGRHLVTTLESKLESVEIETTAGSWLIDMDQPRARLISLLLEPASGDSLIRWGFFDTIFEEKEYAEARVLERIAREMLAKDAKLKTEFEARIASDDAFAADPQARLRFFYQRSPYFDQAWMRYPVLRLDPQALERLTARGR